MYLVMELAKWYFDNLWSDHLDFSIAKLNEICDYLIHNLMINLMR